jgi:hypothetical protein
LYVSLNLELISNQSPQANKYWLGGTLSDLTNQCWSNGNFQLGFNNLDVNNPTNGNALTILPDGTWNADNAETNEFGFICLARCFQLPSACPLTTTQEPTTTTQEPTTTTQEPTTTTQEPTTTTQEPTTTTQEPTTTTQEPTTTTTRPMTTTQEPTTTTTRPMTTTQTTTTTTTTTTRPTTTTPTTTTTTTTTTRPTTTTTRITLSTTKQTTTRTKKPCPTKKPYFNSLGVTVNVHNIFRSEFTELSYLIQLINWISSFNIDFFQQQNEEIQDEKVLSELIKKCKLEAIQKNRDYDRYLEIVEIFKNLPNFYNSELISLIDRIRS